MKSHRFKFLWQTRAVRKICHRLRESHLHHAEAVRELSGVPGEVLLSVGVLDVQPHDVHRDVVLVELVGDGTYMTSVLEFFGGGFLMS